MGLGFGDGGFRLGSIEDLGVELGFLWEWGLMTRMG